MAKWLVTGGCGFIGSHLAAALMQRGDQVCILDDLSTGKRHVVLSGAEILIGDVADRAQVREAIAGVDGCFHLAAIASVQRGTEDWLGTHRTNLTGAITVFDAARSARASKPIPVVYASSAAVYGDNPDMPLGEQASQRPLSAYGADKLGCELHGRVASHVHGVPTNGLRFFNVYGPRQDPHSPYSGVIAIFASRIARGEAIDIFGDGQQVRDFIYVSDVVAYLLAAMAAPIPEARIFNVCTGRATSVLELAETIGSIVGRKPEIRHMAARDGDVRVSVGNPRAAEAAFGIAARVALRDGLARTLADLRIS